MQKKICRILAAVLVLALVAGFLPILNLSVKASAAEGKDVVYSYVIDISKYRTAMQKHDANNDNKFDLEAVYADYPEKDGYVFAGWYTDTVNEVALDKSVTTGGAYAKFVPEKLMKAVAQVSTTTDYTTASSALRFVAAVESMDYEQVGFLLNKEGSSKTYTHASTQVYTKLSAAVEGGSLKPTYFHKDAAYMFALTLTGIKDQSANYVATPFWITFDGTKVDHIPTTNKAVEMGVAANIAAGKTPFDPDAESIRWYDSAKTEFVLTTAGELKGLATLSKSNDFAGKTIKLGADIALNVDCDFKTPAVQVTGGWAMAEGYEAWNGIGSPEVPFAGTFDGQGYTVTGLVQVGAARRMGLFDTTKGATVKNVRVERSYFRHNEAADVNVCGTSAVIGRAINTTVVGVYSDAILANGGTMGGIVAFAEGTVNISNCCFAGELNGAWANTKAGGIVGMGYATATTINITNCLFAGKLSATFNTSAYVGGIIGIGNYSNKVNITNCLSAGNMNNAAFKGTTVGAITGNTPGGGGGTYTNVYATNECFKNADGNAVAIGNGTKYTGTVTLVAKADITGAAAQNVLTGFDFKTVWSVSANDVPKLGADGVDISWYDDDQTQFVLVNAKALLGFAYLGSAGGVDFSGKTVKLGADIVLNEGSAENWATNPPATPWTPLTTEFKGTFDGQNHTITGLYLASSATDYDGMFKHLSGTVKNLTLQNSYVSGSGKIGTVVGAMTEGSLENVHVNGTVKGSQYVGGLIGYHGGENAITVDNCSFSGTVSGTNYLAGIISFRQNTGDETIKNCTVSGTITGTGTHIGGVAGYYPTNGGTVLIESCDVGATITTTTTNQCQTGGIIGRTRVTGTTTVKDCHYFGTMTVGAYASGGIIGCVDPETTGNYAIEGCSFTGSITGENHWIGGMVGYAKKGTISLKNCMSTGKIVSKHTSNSAVGAMIGRCDVAVTATGCYGVSNSYYKTSTLKESQVGQGTVNGSTALLPDNARTLMEAYYAAGIALDFTNGLANYNGTASFEISTAGQLFAFNLMGQCYDFGGKTVKLTKDIAINEGSAADWAVNAPKYNWTPIGGLSASAFAGTFNGQGYTISGLYCAYANGNSMGLFREVTGTVTNFKLVNSYLANTVDSTWGYNGGIAATATGTISKVYTDAIVETVGSYAGGIVGYVAGAAATVSECIFDGTLNARCYVDKVCDNNYGAIRGHARYVGGIVGNNDCTTLTVKDCIYSGLIINTDNGAHRTAGIVGGAYNAGKVATITGCFSLGAFCADANSYHFSMLTDIRTNSGTTQPANADTIHTDNYVLSQNLYDLTGKNVLNGNSSLSAMQSVSGTVRYSLSAMVAAVDTQYREGTSKLNFRNVWKYTPGQLPALRWLTNDYQILKTHYITTEEGKQLLMVSMPDKSYDEFVDMNVVETETGKTYTATTDSGTVTLPYYYLDQVNEAPVDFKDIFYGYGTYLTKYTGTTLVDARNLIADMKDFGFEEKISSNLNEDCYYTALVYDGNVYAVTHFVETGETYISASHEQKLSPYMQPDHYKTAVNKAGGEPYTAHEDVTITSVKLINGGDAFVIRLKNGHFIVIDGGTNNQTDRNAVAAALGASAENYQSGDNSKNNNPQIVVDAWFFTHAHADHCAIFRGGIYGAIQVDVYIKGFYYNFTEKWHEDAKIKVGSEEIDGYVNMAYAYADQDDNGKNFYTKGTGDTSEWWVERTSTHKTASVVNNPSWDGASTKQNIPIYRVQAGQKFYFDGMTVEIPYTQEQVQPSQMHLDLNGTCSWYLLTDDYGHTFLDAGDAERWNAEGVTEFYSPNYKLYGTDVGKTFHHGLNPLVKYTGTGSPQPSGSTNKSYNYALVDVFYGINPNVGDGQQTKFAFITKGETSWIQISGYNNAAGSQRDLSIHEMRYLFGYVLTSKYGITVSNVKNYPTISTKIPFAAYGGDFTNGSYTDTFEGTTTVTMNANGITWDKSHTRGIYK